MFLREKPKGKHKSRRRPAGEWITYEQAAKRANSQVLGSLRASMTLTPCSLSKTIKKYLGAWEGTHCSFLNVLFSTPAWLSLIRTTTLTRSSGVKNQALVGESGKKDQKVIEVMKVRMPVIAYNHCQGSKPGVWMCVQPKASKPKKMMATPFMRTGNEGQKKFSRTADEKQQTHTSTQSSASAHYVCRTWR